MSKNATPQVSTEIGRFDFSSKQADETATLGELITHLEAELQKLNAEPITTRSLKRTSELLQKSIGISLTNRNQPLSLSTLKTARLLFMADLKGGRNVIQLLTPPKTNINATMEFSSVTTIPRDQDASELIKTLTDALALEIDAGRLGMFSRLLGDRDSHSVTERLLLHFERTNDEVAEVLRQGLGEDESMVTIALSEIASVMDNFSVEQTEDLRTPANEAMYTYLQTLPFRHFIQHYPRHLEQTRIELQIGDIRDEAERLLRLAAGDAQLHCSPSSRAFSANSFHHLLLEWPEEMCGLVQKATGIATTVKQLIGHTHRAKALLVSYAYRSLDCTDPSAAVLSLYDVVAAFSSFRYQQVEGGAYKPYWHGQTDQGKDPQRLFDKGLNPEDPHQHQGVMQIYLNRFYEYQASFHGTIRSYRAWMRLQASTLGAYQAVLDLKDIAAISMAMGALNFYCVCLAKDYVIEHFTKHE